jgi:hypothetical protein
MKIKKNDNVVYLETATAKAAYPLINVKKEITAVDVVLISDKEVKSSKDVVVVDTPGEYETKDIFIYSLSEHVGKIDLFSIDIEGINVVAFDSNNNVLQLINSDNISENNILLCNIGDDYSKLSDVIDELEPDVLILCGVDGDKVGEALKKLSLTAPEVQTSYSFTEDDFSAEEEKSMQVFVLK